MPNIYNLSLIIFVIWIIANILESWTDKWFTKSETSNRNSINAVKEYKKRLSDQQIENQSVNNLVIKIKSLYNDYLALKIDTNKKRITYSIVSLIIIVASVILTLISKNPFWQVYPISSLLIINILFMISFRYTEYKIEKRYRNNSSILIIELIDSAITELQKSNNEK
jgi:hypothetical protein